MTAKLHFKVDLTLMERWELQTVPALDMYITQRIHTSMGAFPSDYISTI